MNLASSVQSLSALLFLLATAIPTASSAWLKNLTSSNGINMGNGLILRIQKLNRLKSSPLEKHALRLDYQGYGVSFGKAQERDAVEVALFLDDFSENITEGRARKDDSAAMMMLVGYKVATVGAAFFAIVAALVLKSIIVAKIAFVLSTILIVSKLFHHGGGGHSKAYVEVEPPEYEFPPHFFSAADDFHPSASAANAYYAYNGFVPSDSSAVASGYGTVQASVGNSSDVEREVVAETAARRREYKKRRNHQIPLLTIHRYSSVDT